MSANFSAARAGLTRAASLNDLERLSSNGHGSDRADDARSSSSRGTPSIAEQLAQFSPQEQERMLAEMVVQRMRDLMSTDAVPDEAFQECFEARDETSHDAREPTGAGASSSMHEAGPSDKPYASRDAGMGAGTAAGIGGDAAGSGAGAGGIGAGAGAAGGIGGGAAHRPPFQPSGAGGSRTPYSSSPQPQGSPPPSWGAPQGHGGAAPYPTATPFNHRSPSPPVAGYSMPQQAPGMATGIPVSSPPLASSPPIEHINRTPSPPGFPMYPNSGGHGAFGGGAPASPGVFGAFGAPGAFGGGPSANPGVFGAFGTPGAFGAPNAFGGPAAYGGAGQYGAAHLQGVVGQVNQDLNQIFESSFRWTFNPVGSLMDLFGSNKPHQGMQGQPAQQNVLPWLSPPPPRPTSSAGKWGNMLLSSLPGYHHLRDRYSSPVAGPGGPPPQAAMPGYPQHAPMPTQPSGYPPQQFNYPPPPGPTQSFGYPPQQASMPARPYSYPTQQAPVPPQPSHYPPQQASTPSFGYPPQQASRPARPFNNPPQHAPQAARPTSYPPQQTPPPARPFSYAPQQAARPGSAVPPAGGYPAGPAGAAPHGAVPGQAVPDPSNPAPWR